jgi:hypothetical protein
MNLAPPTAVSTPFVNLIWTLYNVVDIIYQMVRPKGARYDPALTYIRVSHKVKDKLLSLRRTEERTFNDILWRILLTLPNTTSLLSDKPDLEIKRQQSTSITASVLRGHNTDKMIRSISKELMDKISKPQSKRQRSKQYNENRQTTTVRPRKSKYKSW